MADEPENDDQWLYGDNPDGRLPESETAQENELENQLEPETNDTADLEQPPQGDGPPGVENNQEEQEDGEVQQNGDEEDEEDDDDDDSDDGVNVVIGDIKTTASTYSSVNIKRGGLITGAPIDKNKQVNQQVSGKFNVEEFEQIGTINGVPATEYNLDSLEDKPWRKPGADITDYFNYGFNEDTWRAYIERQKRMRVNESGVGLAAMNSIGMPRGPIPIMNDNSKYAGNYIGMRKAGPPPCRRLNGAIDVIGGPTPQRNVPTMITGGGIQKIEPKISTIQVMTADRREYSRKPGAFPDMSMPPPGQFVEEFQPEYGFNPEPEPFYGGYEPTQDSQWVGNQTNWAPTDIKTLTGAPPPMPAPAHIPMGPPPMGMKPPSPGGRRDTSPHRESRDRGESREPSRSRSEKPRDRERERSHRRDRSRSKSRRHRSRSRSPSHRSHRKKKSRRHDDSD